MRKYYISALKIEMDLPEELIHPNLKPFEKEFEQADVVITLCSKKCDNCSFFNAEGSEKIVAEDDTVYYTPSFLNIKFANAVFLLGICISEENGHYIIKCCINSTSSISEYDREEFFDRIKGAVFCVLQKTGHYVLHSASVIINGKVYAFSAFSGTGKTTHIKKLQKAMMCPVFNGDLLAFAEEDGEVKAFALPWCGESKEFTYKNLPLGGIIFLNRGEINEIKSLSGFQAEILLMQRLYAINFTEEALKDLSCNLDKLSTKIKFATLRCLPNDEAGIVSGKYIVKEMAEK